MKGLRTPAAEKIACRNCTNAEKGGVCKSICKAFPEGKPSEVLFDNAPCPKHEKGEDLLEYEIEI
jgi:hypothetical protein